VTRQESQIWNRPGFGYVCGLTMALGASVSFVAARGGILAGLSADDVIFARFLVAGTVMLPFVLYWGIGDLAGIAERLDYIADLGVDVEEAAASLGASRTQTLWRVVLPAIAPALLTGFALAFARGVGEYGSVIFIAGNMPYRTEIAPLLIVVQLEQYNVAGATAIAVTMLVASFILLLITNLLQGWHRRRMAA
jgi:sulfate transport system permease protein